MTTTQRLSFGAAVLAVLGIGSVAFAATNPVQVDTALSSCGPTTISAHVTAPTGVSNMYLVVDDGSSVQYQNIPTDGSSATIDVGPYSTDTSVSWRVFGGGERDYDIPLWNGYGTPTFTSDISAYGTANGWSWVLSGTSDPNPFTTWNSLFVPACAPLINGGGQLLQGSGHGKNADVKNISFGTTVYDLGGGAYSGNLDIVFHNVGSDLSGSHFDGTNFAAVNLFHGTSASCHAAMNMTVDGTLNGAPGYKVIFRAGDAPNNPATLYPDTVRISLYHNNSLVYDTYTDGFGGSDNCVGSARTGLDKGNITINY